MITPWLKSPNLYAVLAILALVVVIYSAGGGHERRKADAVVAKVNKPILEQRGKDEAELAAEADKAKTVDELVKAALSKRFILDAETAALLAKVK